MPKNIFNSLKRYVDRAKSNARSAAMRASYVDTRSDTTRKGYHESRTRYGYNYGANENGITGTIARVIDGKDHNPYLQTGIAPMPDKIASTKDISRIYNFFKKLTNPKITVKNVSKITPKQWTAAQDAAIAKGDMAEAQRLRDLHFKVLSGETPTHFYRGSRKGSRNTYYRSDGSAVWLTPDDDAAAFYTNDGIKDLYLKSEPSLITIDGKGSKHNMIPRELLPKDIRNLVDKPYVNTTEVAHYAKKAGHNQVNFINVEDFARTRIYPYPQTATRNYGNIKSADAVAYDDNGVRIPLGDRDNFNINDIRWSWLLPIFGAGAATAVNAKNKNKSKLRLGGIYSLY